MHQAFIANYGIITAIGNNASENLKALQAGNAGLTLPDMLTTNHRVPVGEIKLTNSELAKKVTIPDAASDSRLPRTALLSLVAAQEAWMPLAAKSTGLKVGMVSANTVGGMDLTEQFYRKFRGNTATGDLTQVRYHECAAITRLTCRGLQLSCWNTTISTACSSSANSIMMGARMIEKGMFDIVIAGGADSLSTFTLNGFNALMILDKELCQPFDENRRGLNLGEGAAYLVLGSERALQQLQVPPEIFVSGYANANDAYHQTASSPEGTGNMAAMRGALQQATLPATAVDYINLHGTGTENNDASEGKAIDTLFTGQVPPASSTKAFTGHTLGAAGAVEAVFSAMSIRHQTTWPHLRLQDPMPTLSWRPQTTPLFRPVRHVLSNSFGFGGNCSTLLISRRQ